MTASLQKPLLIRLLEFLLRPTYPPLSSQTNRQILIEIVQLFGFSLVARFLFIIPTAILSSFVGIDNQIPSILGQKSIAWALLLIVFLAPLMEELIFRLFLRPSPLNLVAPLCPILFLNIRLALSLTEPLLAKLRPIIPGWLLLISLFMICCLLCASIYPLVKKRFDHSKAEQFYVKNISYIFYLSSIIFGLLHIFNFDNFEKNIYFSLLIAIPYILGGFIFGYVRIVYGFRWAYFLHSFNNAYAFFPFAFMSLVLGNSNPDSFSKSPFTFQQVFVILLMMVYFFWSLSWAVSTSWRLLQQARHCQG